MEQFTRQEKQRIGLYFTLSVWGKGIISAAEILAGVLVFFIPVSTLTSAVLHFTQSELAEDSTDIIATFLSHTAQQFAVVGSTFIALYLLSRGLIKLLLVVGLLKNQMWAYPASLIVLGLFVLYQCYQIAVTLSLFLIALTVFDLVVMWFIWREWEVVREKNADVTIS